MSGRREWLALGALVLVSTAFRAWAAVSVPVPWITPDETVYGLLGRSLYLHGSLEILGGQTPFYSLLVPALVGFPLSVFGLATGLDVLQGLQALVMSLAAVPVYLWGRSLVSRGWALAAAALAVAVPGLTYAGLMMSEVLFYPLLVLAAWALAEAIARPTRLTQGLLVVAVLAVCATRVQAIVLLPVALTAAVVDGWLARSWASLRRLWPAAAVLGGLAVVWIAYRLGSGSGTLGGYEVITTTSWSIGAAAKYVVYHLASVLILCGLFPVAALAVLFVRAVRSGEPDPRVRAFLAVASSLTVWLVLEVGVFTSHYSDRIVERNLIALGPVLFLGLVLWIDRGAPGSLLERGVVAGAAALVLVVLPVRRLVDDLGIHDSMSMVPLYKLVQASLARDDADGLPRGGRCRCRRVRAAPAPCRSVRSDGARGRRRRGLCGRRQVRRRPGRRPAAGIPRRHSALDRPEGGWAGRVPLRRRALVERRLGNPLLERKDRPRLRPRGCGGARPAATDARRGATRRHALRAALCAATRRLRRRLDLGDARRGEVEGSQAGRLDAKQGSGSGMCSVRFGSASRSRACT